MGIVRRALGVLAAAGAAGVAVGRWGHRRARHRYEDALERALAGGALSDAERAQLERLRSEEHLSADEARLVALSIYRKALQQAAADDRLTPEEESGLADLQVRLGLSDADIAADERQYARLRLLASVERGRLLPVLDSPFTLAAGERAHWIVRGTAGEELAVRGARLRTRGVRFALPGRGVFEVPGQRPALHDDAGFLPRDLGMLVVTDRRTVFRGARRRVEVPHLDLSELVVFEDGVVLDPGDGELLACLVEDAELTAAILYQAARRRQLPLPGAPARTA
jgi:hypothetical protein